jgi:hypothetical protein
MNAAEAPWLPLVERANSLDPDPDLAHVSDADLERDLRDTAARIAALTCQWLTQVTEFVVRGLWADQGARTPGQWLSWACSMAPGTAREHIRVGWPCGNCRWCVNASPPGRCRTPRSEPSPGWQPRNPRRCCSTSPTRHRQPTWNGSSPAHVASWASPTPTTPPWTRTGAGPGRHRPTDVPSDRDGR